MEHPVWCAYINRGGVQSDLLFFGDKEGIARLHGFFSSLSDERVELDKSHVFRSGTTYKVVIECNNYEPSLTVSHSDHISTIEWRIARYEISGFLDLIQGLLSTDNPGHCYLVHDGRNDMNIIISKDEYSKNSNLVRDLENGTL
jgi:hypothetical protein